MWKKVTQTNKSILLLFNVKQRTVTLLASAYIFTKLVCRKPNRNLKFYLVQTAARLDFQKAGCPWVAYQDVAVHPYHHGGGGPFHQTGDWEASLAALGVVHSRQAAVQIQYVMLKSFCWFNRGALHYFNV